VTLDCKECLSCIKRNACEVGIKCDGGWYTRDHTVDENGKPLNVYKIILENKRDGFRFSITEYGKSQDEVSRFWKEHNSATDIYEFLSCEYVGEAR